MKNFSTWLIAMFAFMFWGLRLVGTVFYSLGMDFMFEPTNIVMEVALLFITFVCICFIIKRKLLAGIIYLVSHFMYYGPTFVTNFTHLIQGTLDTTLYMSALFEFFALVLSIAAVFDLLVDKNRKLNPKDEKTDWFYTNKEYDREMDKRADKNNYRTF